MPAEDGLTDEQLAAILDAHAPWEPCVLARGLSAWHARDEVAVWTALEDALGRKIGTPYFCVPWPGAQAIARHIEREPSLVAGKVVVDVGCGSGVAATQAQRWGAARAVAVDVDALAVQSARILAARHRQVIEARVGDPLLALALECDVVLAADLVSREEQRAPYARAIERWVREGKQIVAADSGRPFFDPCGLTLVDEAELSVPKGVEGASTRVVRVYATPGTSPGSTR